MLWDIMTAALEPCLSVRKKAKMPLASERRPVRSPKGQSGASRGGTRDELASRVTE